MSCHLQKFRYRCRFWDRSALARVHVLLMVKLTYLRLHVYLYLYGLTAAYHGLLCLRSAYSAYCRLLSSFLGTLLGLVGSVLGGPLHFGLHGIFWTQRKSIAGQH